MAPLRAVMPELQGNLVRSVVVRLAAVVAGPGCAVEASLPVVLSGSVAGDPAPEAVRLLLSLGVFSAVLVGELAWMVVLGFGLLSVVVDGAAQGEPLVQQWLAGVGLPLGLATLAVSGAVYVVRGPNGVARSRDG